MRTISLAALIGLTLWLGWSFTISAQSPLNLPPSAGETHLVTIGVNGEPSNGGSSVIDMSGDGRWVLVQSDATNLVPETNGYTSFVVRDMENETNWLVPLPHSTPGFQIRFVVLSDDGNRFFLEYWDPYIANSNELYLYERATDQFERIRANNGQLPNGVVEAVDFSGDGRYALFYGEANNIVAGDTNFVGDLFLYDRITRQSVMVSKAGDGTLANAESRNGTVGADGRYVVFASHATNLVVGDTNNVSDVFRHDTMTGETVRVSVRSGGAQLYTPSHDPSISRDGRYVSFVTDATDCELPAAPLPPVICLRDMQMDETRRISRRADGSDPTSEYASYLFAQVAADGEYVILNVWGAWNLIPEDSNNIPDIYRYTVASGELTRISVGDDEREAAGSSGGGKVSADGQIVAFATDAANLGTYDPNAKTDVYWRRQNTTPPPTPTATPTRLANALFLPVANGDRPLQDYPSLEGFHADTGNNPLLSLSEDGKRVLFITEEGLVPGDEDTGSDAYYWNRDSDSYGIIGGTAQPAVAVYFATLSANGRYVLFSTQTGYDHNDTNGYSDLYRQDLERGIIRWVSYGSEGVTQTPAALSANGRYAALTMSLNGLHTLYVRDLDTGATTPIIKKSGDPFTFTVESSFSADGTTVMVAEPSGYTPLCYFGPQVNLYRGDTTTGRAVPVLVSTPTLAIMNGAMAGDGQTIAYRYVRSEDGYLRMGIRLRQLDGSERTIAEHPIGFNYPCYLSSPSFSADGRWVVFDSFDLSGQLPDYLPDTNIVPDVFLYDSQRDFLRRVSLPTGVEGAGQSNGESWKPTISANGRVVAFASRAGNLVAGLSAGLNVSHLYVWGR